MNVAEVIEELSKLPLYLPVRAVMSNVMVIGDHEPYEIHPADDEAQEVTAIQWRGPDVVLACDGMCL